MTLLAQQVSLSFFTIGNKRFHKLGGRSRRNKLKEDNAFHYIDQLCHKIAKYICPQGDYEKLQNRG